LILRELKQLEEEADHFGYHDYHHHYGHHDEGHSHQSDPFDMDEDISHDFRKNLVTKEPFKGEHPVEMEQELDGKEGILSRSPSSVMLFEQAI
jgi:hypothetical protein